MAGYISFVVDESGTERTFRLPFSKVDATAAPDASNDGTEGYKEGSLWVDVTNDKAYTCLDNSTGAAVWVEQGGSGGSGTVTSVDVSGGTTGLTFSGGPVTTSGTITMAGTLALENGGTEADLSATGPGIIGQTSSGAALGVLTTATYPSLTELAYVKGVTSAIQTQLDAKQPLDTQLTSLAGLSYGSNALKVVRVNAGETDFELAAASSGVTDHGALTGLTDDDHTQYALLAGRSGGQEIKGGTASGNDLQLTSTSHVTKGSIYINDPILLPAKAAPSASVTGVKIWDDSSTGKIKSIRSGGTTESITHGLTTANSVFASATSGGAAIPSFRALVEADIPSISASKITSGTLPVTRGGTGVAAIQSASTYRNANYSLPTAAWTKVPLDTERVDVGGVFDSTTNYRFTPTVAGMYSIAGMFYSSDCVSNTLYAVAAYKNGSLNVLGNIEQITATITNKGFLVNGIVAMNGSTDCLEMFAYNGHATLTLTLLGGANNNRFDSIWAGPSS